MNRKCQARPASERRRITQFNWKGRWNTKVVPHLGHPLVQLALDLGMMLLKPDWKTGDAPYLLGEWLAFGRRKGVPGKLSWYRPIGRCHWIAFFSMAVGVLNYPHLDWRMVAGIDHTVPVGYDADGQPSVVMDILLFDSKTAEESLEFAQEVDAPNSKEWQFACDLFMDLLVPKLRAYATGRPECDPDGGRSAGHAPPHSRRP